VKGNGDREKMKNPDKPALGLPLSESSLEDLKAKLEKEDFLSFGRALQKLEASQNTIQYFTCLVIGNFLATPENTFEDLENLVDRTVDLFSWGPLEEQVELSEVASFASALKIEVFLSKDSQTHQVMKAFEPRVFNSLLILEEKNLLLSWCSLIPPYDGISLGVNEIFDSLQKIEDLLYVGGAEFVLYNWDVFNQEPKTINCPRCTRSDYFGCQITECERREIRIQSGSDMDLRVWVNEDKSVIAATGQWEEIDDLFNHFDSSAFLDRVRVPYVVGTIQNKGKIGISQYSLANSDFEFMSSSNLEIGRDFSVLETSSRVHLLVGWKDMDLGALGGDGDVNEFETAINSCKDWLNHVESGPVSGVLNETLYWTWDATLLSGLALSNFRDYCQHMSDGKAYFGRQQYVDATEIGEWMGGYLKASASRLTEIAREETDPWILEAIAANPHTPPEDLLWLSGIDICLRLCTDWKHACWTIRKAAGKNPSSPRESVDRAALLEELETKILTTFQDAQDAGMIERQVLDALDNFKGDFTFISALKNELLTVKEYFSRVRKKEGKFSGKWTYQHDIIPCFSHLTSQGKIVPLEVNVLNRSQFQDSTKLVTIQDGGQIEVVTRNQQTVWIHRDFAFNN